MPDTEPTQIPIPDTTLYRRMAEGHRRRTGHDLTGYLADPEGRGICTLVRTCCKTEQES